MQLKSKKKIAGLLATATCSLLNTSASAEENPGWRIDSAILGYSEEDRVDTIEPVVSATRTFDDGRQLNIKLVADSLTGASPNGALHSDQPQTFTRPSGRGDFTTPAGEVPLDDTFKDSRAALSVQYDFPVNRLTRISTGLAYSKEYDYTSTGLNFSLARDFNDKNTTITGGIALARDTIEPEGGVPLKFASMLPAGDAPTRQGSDEDKTVTDVLLGITQVINRKMLTQFNYSFSNSSGYHTDPFKLLSVADGTTGEPIDYVFESRPDSRTKHSLYMKTKYYNDYNDIADVSYRYLWDDWDITSHTVDFRYRFQRWERFYVEPHLRYYSQSEAGFFQHSLIASAMLPEHATADPRLGAFDGITIGARFGFKLNDHQEVSFRFTAVPLTSTAAPFDRYSAIPCSPDHLSTVPSDHAFQID